METRRHSGLRTTGILGLTLVLGCAVGPDYVEPVTEVPDRWEVELSRGLQDGTASYETWWTLLDDAMLTSLVERAQAGNLDLRLALARVTEGRADRGLARGDWFPGIFGTSNYMRSQLSEEIFGLLPGAGEQMNNYNIGLDASWELDVFGRIRRNVEASNADLQRDIEDYRDTMVIVMAEVASAYVIVRTSQERLTYARGNVELQRASVGLTRDRNRAGLAPDLDVRQAELNLHRTAALIPTLEQDLAFAIHRLGVLLGEHPAALRAELMPDAPIPQPPGDVALGLPRDLVRQRPDVRAAEREIAAATARIGVFTAELWPRFTILGSFAFSAMDAAKFFTGKAFNWSVGPAVSWNLFDGGRVRSAIHAQDARTEQALVIYESTVLGALEESENFMVAYMREWERRDELERSVVAADESARLVKTLYVTGLTNFQNVLDMERSLAEQQDFLAVSDGQVTLNLIGIYRSLGGGWTP